MMKMELMYLVWIALFTALLWVPYILNRIVMTGLLDAVGYPSTPAKQSPWAYRLQKAHNNAVENLVVFAALVLAASALGISTPAIGMAAMVYFWARVVHAAAFTFGVPWVRTLAFFVGWVCQIVIGLQILQR